MKGLHPFLRPDNQIANLASGASSLQDPSIPKPIPAAFKINDFTLNTPFEILASEFKDAIKVLTQRIVQHRESNPGVKYTDFVKFGKGGIQ